LEKKVKDAEYNGERQYPEIKKTPVNQGGGAA
jgi:hypothetical protein